METAAAYTKTTAVPRWRAVLADVQGRLASGSYPPGAEFPTLGELCATYGVSNITGRRVFRELQQLGQIASRGRRGTIVTRTTSRQTVYLCFRDECFEDGRQPLGNYWILHHIAMGLASSPVSAWFDFVPVSLSFCQSHFEQLQGHPVVACADVLFIIHGDTVRIDEALRDELEQRLQPIYFHTIADLTGVTAIGVSPGACLTLTVEHLLGRGHRRIALFNGASTSPWYRPRLHAYLDALHRAGLGFAPELVRITSGRQPAEDQAALDAVLALPEPPTAIVCANDSRALAVLEGCRRRGVRVPADLAVTGSDNLPESAFAQPPLTTVDGCQREQGRVLADWLARRLAGEQLPRKTEFLAPRLLVRQST